MTSFTTDEKMDQALEELREHFNLKSKSEVLKRAVALLKVATEYEDADGAIVIRKDNVDQAIRLK